MAQVALPKMAPLQGVKWDQYEMKHVDVQIKSCPVKFYNIFRKEAFRLPIMSPDYVKSIHVLKGDWNSLKSEKQVTYYPEGKSKGKTESFQDELLSAIDSAKSVTFQILKGEIMANYKSFYAELTVTNLDGCNWARWTVAYEKKTPCSPGPDQYLDLLEKICKDVDAHIHCN